MSGVVSALASQPAAATPTTPAQPATNPAANTAAPTTPKQEETKPISTRPLLPSLKRANSISVKDAMAGKVSPPTTSSTPNSGNSITPTDSIDSFDDADGIIEAVVEEVDLTPKNLERVWARFADNIKATKTRIGFSLLSNKPTLIDDNLITFDVVNLQQKEELMTVYNELIGHVRKSLGSPMLQLEFNLVEADVTNSRPYTIEEKFKHMAHKNPAVLTLKQVLGLDFE